MKAVPQTIFPDRQTSSQPCPQGAAGQVILRTRVGTNRIVDMITGEELPRIC